MTTRISILGDTHYISGMGKDQPILLRPYTPDEHTLLAKDKEWPEEMVHRVVVSLEQPGDVLLDLGSNELNYDLIMLFNRALNARWKKGQP